MQPLKKRDRRAFDAIDALPRNALPFIVRQKPTDLLEARERFEKTGTPPVFHYPSAHRLNVEAYLDGLKHLGKRLPTLLPDEPIILSLYESKLEELRLRASLRKAVQQEEGKQVTELSEQLFGKNPFSADELKQEWARAIERVKPKKEHAEPVNAEQFEIMVRRMATLYDLKDLSVYLYDGSSVKIRHGNAEAPRIFIPKEFQASVSRSIRLLTHEIEGHLLRTYNGIESPLLILGRGLDHYLETEEGLAIYLQMQALPANLLRPGFWDAWAVCLAKETDFVTTYETLFEAKKALENAKAHPDPEGAARNSAWNLCVRVYRGITDTSEPGVAFVRDHLYRSGQKKIEAAMQKDDTLLETLFQGNMGLNHVEEVRMLQLPPARLPKFKAKEVVEEVLGP